MRTTLTLDDDVAAALKRLQKAKHAAFRELVNEALRRGIKQMSTRPSPRSQFQTRSVALGHPQRGGIPSSTDRIMGYLFGTAAVEAVMRKAWGKMVSANGIAPACTIDLVPLADAVKELRLVDVKRYYDTERYYAAEAILPPLA